MVVGTRGAARGHGRGDPVILEASEENIARAARAIREGKLVGMPTETVYGIAADATNVAAVRQTFSVKGRPAGNPLIVHLASIEAVSDVALEFPHVARALAEAFWPGPLTLVLPKRDCIPAEVTAGLDTVAVRIPAHPVAHRLLELAVCPVSAPSANVFTRLSPTRAADIAPEIAGRLEVILDGGSCEFGIESTVVDCSSGGVRVLRLGALSSAEIQGALDRSGADQTLAHVPRSHDEADGSAGSAFRSPGQFAKHYAPRTPLALVERLAESDVGLTFGIAKGTGQISMPLDPRAYAATLYAALATLDRIGAGRISVESPPDGPEWDAVRDRLRRATERW